MIFWQILQKFFKNYLLVSKFFSSSKKIYLFQLQYDVVETKGAPFPTCVIWSKKNSDYPKTPLFRSQNFEKGVTLMIIQERVWPTSGATTGSLLLPPSSEKNKRVKALFIKVGFFWERGRFLKVFFQLGIHKKRERCRIEAEKNVEKRG